MLERCDERRCFISGLQVGKDCFAGLSIDGEALLEIGGSRGHARAGAFEDAIELECEESEAHG
ncbi:MAG: hypothetical protein WKG01_15195 [Kofleriaceae bacterium]